MKLYNTEKLSPYLDERGKLFNPIIQKDLFLGNISNLHVFSSKPGAIRGNHLHPQRNEKFWVIKGKILFIVESLDPLNRHEIEIRAEENILIEIFPNVAHTLKNIGNDEAIVLCYSHYKSEDLDRNPIKKILSE